MFCPKCGKINPDDAQNCSGCDALLKAETPALPAKKTGALKWVITALVIIAIIAVIVFFMSGCSAGELPKENLTF